MKKIEFFFCFALKWNDAPVYACTYMCGYSRRKFKGVFCGRRKYCRWGVPIGVFRLFSLLCRRCVWKKKTALRCLRRGIETLNNKERQTHTRLNNKLVKLLLKCCYTFICFLLYIIQFRNTKLESSSRTWILVACSATEKYGNIGWPVAYQDLSKLIDRPPDDTDS